MKNTQDFPVPLWKLLGAMVPAALRLPLVLGARGKHLPAASRDGARALACALQKQTSL